MSLALYLDETMPRAIAISLRVRGVDVLTAQEDNRRRIDDSILLDRANTLGRVMVSFDSDMLAIGTFRQREGIAKAKAEGKYRGRKPVSTDKRDRVLQLATSGMTKAQMARELQIGQATVYRILANTAPKPRQNP